MMGHRALQTETSKPKSTVATLRRFWQYFRHYWFGLTLALLFVLASAWTTVTAPEYVGQAVDCYLFPQGMGGADTCWYTTINPEWTTGDKLAGLGGLVLILVGLFSAGSILMGLTFYAMNWTAQNVLRRMRQDLFQHIHRLSLNYYGQHEAGDIMSRITNDADTIQQAFSFALVQVFSGVVTIVWILTRMLETNVPYALLSLAISPVMMIMTVIFSKQARKAFRVARREMGAVNADLQEGIAGAREVQAFSREEESIANFEESNAANRAANVKAAVFTSALRPTLEALGYIAMGIVVLVGGIAVLRNEPLLGTSTITLGIVFVFMQYVQRVNQPIAQIAILWTNIQSGIAGGERIFGLLDEAADVVDKPGAVEMPEIQGRVAFDGVHAEYVKDEIVLDGMDFVAEPGQTVAIVGPTGAGKTTMINLIPRFYDVSDGAVTIDGTDVRDVTLASLRPQIGLVLQDTFLFSDTVLNNIRYGNLDATDEEVIEAAKLVAAHEFILRLENGYETVLGERGSGLSQGQRQLIAIARVALMNPNILILDEATSSVDTRTERVIQAAFDKLLHGRTSFVIAHRLSTIRNADLVLMVDEGKIIERGTHRELLEQRGAYYDLYMSQFLEENGNGVTVNGVGETVPEPEPASD